MLSVKFLFLDWETASPQNYDTQYKPWRLALQPERNLENLRGLEKG